MLKIDIITLFPRMFTGPFAESIVKRAHEKKLVEIKLHNLRKWTTDKHKTVDDRPFGGGTGMVLMVEPVDKALQELRAQESTVILLTPQGKTFNQKKAQAYSKKNHLILIAGHYEGYDERIRQHLVDEQLSIGNFILTGGELAAMIVVDAVTRLIPGVLEKETATQEESFSFSDPEGKKILEYPQYTRPAQYKNWSVPKPLLSGNHAVIEKWRLDHRQSYPITKKKATKKGTKAK
ncbi:tRNA (guanosine(37)-N1)-methyltransferase TrmD [Patescibacteria group bacterium]|nr:tRNA (guanosine(37)-N1)-methyltransferase TrmD [Patescibacteria group bacterium]